MTGEAMKIAATKGRLNPNKLGCATTMFHGELAYKKLRRRKKLNWLQSCCKIQIKRPKLNLSRVIFQTVKKSNWKQKQFQIIP